MTEEERQKQLATPSMNTDFVPGYMTGNPILTNEDMNRYQQMPVNTDTPPDFSNFDTQYWGTSNNLATPSIVAPNITQTPGQLSQPTLQTSVGLTPRASALNNYPDTSKWESSDLAKANTFAEYGNPWDTSMNQNTQPQIASPQARSTEIVKGSSQVTQQDNTSTGNRVVRDMFGKELTSSDMRQMENEYLAQELARKAMQPDTRQSRQVLAGYSPDQYISGKRGILAGSPIYKTIEPQGPSQAQIAAQALSGMAGLTGTPGEHRKNVAASNLYGAQAIAVPEATASDSAKNKAQAEYYSTEAKKVAEEARGLAAENKLFIDNGPRVLGLTNQENTNSSYQNELAQIMQNRKKRAELIRQSQGR
jgi:hypothetical protein